MTMFGTLTRCAALAGLLAAASAVAGPALAAPADVALLKSYLGNWKGRGTLSTDASETVVCRLALSEGNEEKVNYSGRCTIAGANLSINGTLAFVDANKRFEAVMTSNTTFQGIAVGRKQGGGIVFNLKERDTTEGNDMTITAGIRLINGTIDVKFDVFDAKTGDTMSAAIPFSK